MKASQKQTAYFSIERELSLGVTSELALQASRKAEDNLQKIVPTENTFHFKHGKDWSGSMKVENNETGSWKSTFKTASVETNLSLKDIEEMNLEAFQTITETMFSGVSNMLEDSTVKDTVKAAERSSMSVNLRDDLKEGLLEMQRKVAPSLDANFRLSLPSLFLNPKDLEELSPKIVELQNDPDYMNQLNEIQNVKWLEAIILHCENLLKFNLKENERRIIDDWLQHLRKLH